MKLKQIESLLLQEMGEVKGGRSDICACPSGAIQSSGGGTCTCPSGAVQIVPDPDPVCFCTQGGALQKK